ALRLIVEREDEIAAFKPQEYWTIEAAATHAEQAFKARLSVFEGRKVEQFTFTDERGAHEARRRILERASEAVSPPADVPGAVGVLTVAAVEKKQRRRNPAAPFTTSTLQQEASRKLGFSASRTMRVAQQLYEGVDIGEGSVGLITYMRTDSVTLANEALDEIRAVIKQRFGADHLPKEPHTYKTKSKNAQEAHEAVRPTSAARAPEDIKRHLTPDQAKLYELIWKRTIACQMLHAVYDTVAADLACGAGNTFRATGSTLVKPGFIAVYLEDEDDKKKDEEEDKTLPPLNEGETITLNKIHSDQHFTEPPPRFSEASL